MTDIEEASSEGIIVTGDIIGDSDAENGPDPSLIKGRDPNFLCTSSIAVVGVSPASSTLSLCVCRICQLPCTDQSNPLISPCRLGYFLHNDTERFFRISFWGYIVKSERLSCILHQFLIC